MDNLTTDLVKTTTKDFICRFFIYLCENILKLPKIRFLITYNSIKMTNPNNALVTLESKQTVKQSNIMVNARYETTLLERKIYMKMLSMIKPDDTDFKDMVIDASVLIEELGLQGLSAYAEFKNATKKLMKCICEIDDKDNNRLIQVGLISSAVYHKGKGLIVLHFDPALKPYILDIESYFTLFDLEEAFGIKSNHSLRVYELLKQYSSTGIRVMSLSDLRFSLNISKEQYPSYFDFKKRIILQAQKDLEKTPMAFSFKELKLGKRVVNIEFRFTPVPVKKEKRTKKELLQELNVSEVKNISKNDTFKDVDLAGRAKVYEGLINLKMSDYQAKSVMQKASDKEIYQVLYQVTIALLDPKINNKAAYAYSVFKKKFNLD